MHEDDLPLRRYLRFLRRQGWLILLVPTAAIILGALVVSRQPSIYRAASGIFVAQVGGSGQPQLGNLPLAQTMTNILTSNVIATDVTQNLDFRLTPSDLLNRLAVQVNPESSILEVTYDSANKGHALQVLGKLETAFNALIREQLGVSGTLHQTGPLQIVVDVIDPPHLEAGRVSPRPTQVVAFAAGLGLVLGFILAFVRNGLDERVRGAREAEKSFGAPVIGVLPQRVLTWPNLNGAPSTLGAQAAIEALERLGAALQLHGAKMGPALLVTSALDDDASSAVVAGLGVVLAQAGQDVVCVEADAVHSRVRMLLATPDEAADSREGVASVVMGKIAAAEAFLDVPVPPSNNGGVAVTDASGSHLMVLPLGVSSNALAPKSSEILGDLVLELSIQAKHVLFDCPRLLSVAHGLPLASAVDGVLVVARDGRIGRGRAAEVRAALESVSVENVGVVLIEDRPRPARRSRGAFLAALRREHLPRWRR